jgi:hypothetical protein
MQDWIRSEKRTFWVLTEGNAGLDKKREIAHKTEGA